MGSICEIIAFFSKAEEDSHRKGHAHREIQKRKPKTKQLRQGAKIMDSVHISKKFFNVGILFLP